jgi:HAD superfamily hydrolase (TIGR01509 family)
MNEGQGNSQFREQDMARPAVFLDDGGVMNDNNVRGPQWQRLVGEFLAPRLGGSPEKWAHANRDFTLTLFVPGAWQARLLASPDYSSFERSYYHDWLAGMCPLVGVPVPSEDDSIALAREAGAWIIPRIRSAFPGAVEAIRLLHGKGYALHTASGESYADLDAYLQGMGVRACFDRLYGPDLIGTFKLGPEYYERLLADACVSPGDALVVDDSPDAVRWAAQAGARAVLVGPAQASHDGQPVETITGLSELLAFIECLEARMT